MKLGHGCLFYASNWRVSILFALSLSLCAHRPPQSMHLLTTRASSFFFVCISALGPDPPAGAAKNPACAGSPESAKRATPTITRGIQSTRTCNAPWGRAFPVSQ